MRLMQRCVNTRIADPLYSDCNVATFCYYSPMTVTEARRYFGSNYAIAQTLGVDRSTVGRWGRDVPDDYADKLSEIVATKGLEKAFSGKKRYKG